MKVKTNIKAGRRGADDAPGDVRGGKGTDDPANHN